MQSFWPQMHSQPGNENVDAQDQLDEMQESHTMDGILQQRVYNPFMPATHQNCQTILAIFSLEEHFSENV